MFPKMQGENSAATLLCSLQCNVSSKTYQKKKKRTRRYMALTPPQVRFASEYLYFGVFSIQRNHVYTEINLGNEPSA